MKPHGETATPPAAGESPLLGLVSRWIREVIQFPYEELVQLKRGLDLADGFALFVVVVDAPRLEAPLLLALRGWRYDVADIDLGAQADATDVATALRRGALKALARRTTVRDPDRLADVLRAAWAERPADCHPVVVLRNFDPGLLVPPGQPTAFHRLNQLRDTLVADVPCPWVFVMRPEQVRSLREQAPDTWSVRTAVLRLRLPTGSPPHLPEPPVDQALDDPQRYLDIIREATESGRALPREVLASLHVRAGDAWAARRQYRQARCEYQKAIHEYRDLVDRQSRTELAPDLAKAYHRRGTACAGLGRLSAAIADYNRTLRFWEQLAGQPSCGSRPTPIPSPEGVTATPIPTPESRAIASCSTSRAGPSERRRERAAVYVARGRAYLKAGRPVEAVADYDRAIAICTEPASDILADHLARAYFGRANALAEQGQFTDAAADYDRAIEQLGPLVGKQRRLDLQDDLALAHLNRGNTAATLGRFDSAIADCDRAVELLHDLVERRGRGEHADSLAQAHMNRGSTYADMGRLADAWNDLNTAVQICHDLNERRGGAAAEGLAVAHLNRGNVSARLRQFAQAVADYDRAIRLLRELVDQSGRRELAEKVALVHLNRGAASMQARRYPEALHDVDQAIATLRRLADTQRPDVADFLAIAHVNRAGIVEKRDGVAAADADYRRAIVWARRAKSSEKLLSRATLLHALAGATAAAVATGEFDRASRLAREGFGILERTGHGALASDYFAEQARHLLQRVAEHLDALRAAGLDVARYEALARLWSKTPAHENDRSNSATASQKRSMSASEL